MPNESLSDKSSKEVIEFKVDYKNYRLINMIFMVFETEISCLNESLYNLRHHYEDDKKSKLRLLKQCDELSDQIDKLKKDNESLVKGNTRLEKAKERLQKKLASYK